VPERKPHIIDNIRMYHRTEYVKKVIQRVPIIGTDFVNKTDQKFNRLVIFLILPDYVVRCGYSNESVMESVEKLNRAIELRDICKYKAPFIVTVLQKCNFHRLVV
jgi:hypothetical protein